MYIYVIGTNERSSPVKIGKTNNPKKRLESLQSGNSRKLRIIHLLQCNSEKQACVLEKVLHQQLKQYRELGEWFNSEGLGRFRKICGRYGELMLPKHPLADKACWKT